jgi:tRNA G37 N-methylase Trm5
MKIRESGMPEESYWESFFDTRFIFSQLQLNKSITDVVEFGSGYGTFSIPAAKIIKGNLHAFDIDPTMIKRLKEKAQREKIYNIKINKTDFAKVGTNLAESSIDYVMLFNILHAEETLTLLKETYRILKYNAKVGIIHWIYSDSTPRGPSLNIRPKPEQCKAWMKFAGFKIEKNNLSFPPYHYGILGIKK